MRKITWNCMRESALLTVAFDLSATAGPTFYHCIRRLCNPVGLTSSQGNDERLALMTIYSKATSIDTHTRNQTAMQHQIHTKMTIHEKCTIKNKCRTDIALSLRSTRTCQLVARRMRWRQVENIVRWFFLRNLTSSLEYLLPMCSSTKKATAETGSVLTASITAPK